MVVNAVSTRKVTEITEALCGTSLSKSTVSRLTVGLDARVNAFLSRRLDDADPFVDVDALFSKARCDDGVASKAVLIAGAVRSDGFRNILGVAVGDVESFATWNELFGSLRKRGLYGLDFVLSDDHAALVKAVSKNSVGASRQRCQAHLMRNALGHCPNRERKNFAAATKTISTATDVVDARRHRDDLAKRFAKTAPACIENEFDDAMAVMALPKNTGVGCARPTWWNV